MIKMNNKTIDVKLPQKTQPCMEKILKGPEKQEIS